jgi:hypothetical protein
MSWESEGFSPNRALEPAFHLGRRRPGKSSRLSGRSASLGHHISRKPLPMVAPMVERPVRRLFRTSAFGKSILPIVSFRGAQSDQNIVPVRADSRSAGIHRCTWDRLLRPPFPHHSIVRQRFLAILAFTLCARLMISGKKERKISGVLRAAGFRLFDS